MVIIIYIMIYMINATVHFYKISGKKKGGIDKGLPCFYNLIYGTGDCVYQRMI